VIRLGFFNPKTDAQVEAAIISVRIAVKQGKKPNQEDLDTVIEASEQAGERGRRAANALRGK
jgi:hypothetical protein